MRNLMTILISLILMAVTTVAAARNNGYYYGYDRSFNRPVAATIPASGKKTVVVDPNTHSWAAYNENGQLVRSGRASLGKNYCPDIRRGCHTVTGTFSVYSKKGPQCRSSRFPVETRGGAPMPYCMHFYKGYAIHGSNDVPNYNASHGCVRVPVADARWLNQEFVEYGTRVIIKPYGKATSKRYAYDDDSYQQVNYQGDSQSNYQANYQTSYNNQNYQDDYDNSDDQVINISADNGNSNYYDSNNYGY